MQPWLTLHLTLPCGPPTGTLPSPPRYHAAVPQRMQSWLQAVCSLCNRRRAEVCTKDVCSDMAGRTVCECSAPPLCHSLPSCVVKLPVLRNGEWSGVVGLPCTRRAASTQHLPALLHRTTHFHPWPLGPTCAVLDHGVVRTTSSGVCRCGRRGHMSRDKQRGWWPPQIGLCVTLGSLPVSSKVCAAEHCRQCKEGVREVMLH